LTPERLFMVVGTFVSRDAFYYPHGIWIGSFERIQAGHLVKDGQSVLQLAALRERTEAAISKSYRSVHVLIFSLLRRRLAVVASVCEPALNGLTR